MKLKSLQSDIKLSEYHQHKVDKLNQGYKTLRRLMDSDQSVGAVLRCLLPDKQDNEAIAKGSFLDTVKFGEFRLESVLKDPLWKDTLFKKFDGIDKELIQIRSCIKRRQALASSIKRQRPPLTTRRSLEASKLRSFEGLEMTAPPVVKPETKSQIENILKFNRVSQEYNHYIKAKKLGDKAMKNQQYWQELPVTCSDPWRKFNSRESKLHQALTHQSSNYTRISTQPSPNEVTDSFPKISRVSSINY